MTGREKIEQAFTAGGAPAFGAVVCYESIFIRDHWEEVTDQPWWVMHSPDIDAKVECFRDRIERMGQDWFALSPGMSNEQRQTLRIEHRPDGVHQVNTATGESRRLERPAVSGWRPDKGCHSVRPEQMPLSREAVDEQLGRSLYADSVQLLRDGPGELPRRVLAGPGRNAFPIGAVGSPLWRNYALWGFEGMMSLVADAPDLVEHACRRHLEQARRAILRLAEIGVRGVWIEECLTDMISPALFRRLNVPFVRAVAEAVREAGMLSVYYYCGDPGDRLDLLLDCGADALHLEESKKGFRIDIEEIVEFVRGRCVVFGNLDAIGLLRRGAEDELRAEIARQIEAGRRNNRRFAMSVGSPVTPETPLSRVRLYTDIVHELSPG